MHDFSGKVAVVTGAGEGLGRACAEILGKRGASVVACDDRHTQTLSEVVQNINKSGGKAVANTDSTLSGHKIIDAAIAAFGSVHILVNAAGTRSQPKRFENVTDAEWDEGLTGVLKGNFLITNAAWKHFRAQGFGRIVNTSSVSGLAGTGEQSIQGAFHHAQIGYSNTLALEGKKKNILVNVVIPASTGPLTAKDLAKVAPYVAYLTHESNQKKSGRTYLIVDGQPSELVRQRSGGLLLRADDTFTPAAVLNNWAQVADFSKHEYPSGPQEFVELLEEGLKLPPNEKTDVLSFKGKVVLITGGGSGLGRAYAMHFARLGASVMINDISDPSSVVEEIQASGGTAASVIASAEEGDKNVEATIRAFGRIDILINNAGILRDRAFHNMTEAMWDPVLAVHLGGTYKNSRAAWPHFVRQKYGRIINTTSVTGIYGAFGQANYAAAKSAIIGLTRDLAREGAQHNILVNVIAPNAGTNMTKSILSEEVLNALRPDHIAPVVSALCSNIVPKAENGGIFEVGSGWCGKTRWEMRHHSGGPKEHDTLQAVSQSLSALENSQKVYPDTEKEHLAPSGSLPSPSEPNRSQTVRENIRRAQSASPIETKFSYNHRDLIIYALSVGARRTDLPLVFERHPDFHALPVFGLVPFFNAKAPYKFEDIMAKYDQRLLLHIDQYLEIRSPIPVAGTLTTIPKLIQVVDKGQDAVVVQGFTTFHDGQEVLYNETTVLIREAGGFGGDQQLRDRGPATARNEPPKRSPDRVVEEKTNDEQAALYRLNGDENPLHIDPAFSQKANFKVPILHGLCSLGIAGKHVYQVYGSFKNLKARFSSPVIPGQTLRTEMWLENQKVIFQVTVVETGKRAISGGGVVLSGPIAAHL